jgi:ssDNA-binding replication factor A large subunit
LPIKTFTTKKGNQSELINLDFGDETAMITCTVFGENATRYSTLELDKIYSISGATVSESKYRGII